MKDLQLILKNELKLQIKHPLIASISGGIDSMVLLSLLVKTDYQIVVVHFNHLKRDESIIEKSLVENYCKEHEIPFHYYTIEINEGNFHSQAHHLRSHYLMEVAKLYKTPYLLTAHHLDDLFENILIKLTRGSNLLGYAGMQQIHTSSHFTFVKPFLFISKKEIVDYALKFKVPYLDDSSNEDNYYLRNRYRHSVVPIMKQENDALLEQIKQYHLQISSAFSFIRETTKSLINSNFVIHLESFKTAHPSVQDDMIAYLIEQSSTSFTYETVQQIKHILLSKKPNQNYTLSKTLSFVKVYDKALIKPFNEVKPFKIPLKEGMNKLQNMAIFTFFLNSNSNTAEFTKLCYNELAFPLWIRHREDGDLLAYEFGHKKLKKLLIDLKVPMEERDHLWVLTDNNNQILWVEKHYLNQTLGNQQTAYIELKGDQKHAS